MLQPIHDAIARRDAVQALALAEAAAKEHAQFADVHHALAIARQMSGDLDGAEAALDQAIALAPAQAGLHVARAALSVARRDPQAAGSALRQAVEQDPNRISAYVMAAHLAIAAGQIDEAEQQLKLARRVDPEHPGVLAVEGNLALLRGQSDEAIRKLTRASELVPEDALSLTSLGIAFLAAGNAAFAEQALRRALAIQPNEARLHWALADALRRQERHVDLAETLDALLKLDPAHRRALAEMLRVQLLQGKQTEATATARRWLALGDVSREEADVLAGLFFHAGDAGSALVLIDEALQGDGDQDGLWQFRHAAAVRAGQGAADVVARWSAALPESPALLSVLAAEAEEHGRPEDAEQLADRALASEPGLLAPLLVKLRVLLQRDPSALTAFAADVAEKAPGGFGKRLALIWQGVGHDRLDEYDQAARCWRAAAEARVPGQLFPAVQAWSATQAEGASPRLLWGPPGSRAIEAVGLVRQSPGWACLDDRFGAGPRPDGIWPQRQDGAIVHREGWAKMLSTRGIDPARAVDWLPHWDGRVDAALGDARLAAVVADPRDLFLNALVFGGPQPWTNPSTAGLAEWLSQSLGQLLRRAEAWPAQTLLLHADTLAEQPGAAAQQLANFFELGVVPSTEGIESLRAGLSGTPLCFAPGRWQAYAGPFAAEFEKLAPTAAQLQPPR